MSILGHELQLAERAFNLACATGTEQERREAAERLSRAQQAVRDDDRITAAFTRSRGP